MLNITTLLNSFILLPVSVVCSFCLLYNVLLCEITVYISTFLFMDIWVASRFLLFLRALS